MSTGVKPYGAGPHDFREIARAAADALSTTEEA